MKARNILTLAWVISIIAACNLEESVDTRFNPDDVTFYASNGDMSATKTILQSDGTINWLPQDEINVFYGQNQSARFVSDNTKAAGKVAFKGALKDFSYSEGTSFQAVYPYREDNYFDGNTIRVTIPSEQVAIAGTFADDFFVSVARTDDFTLMFYNICGGIKFCVTESGVTSVKFTGNADEPLAGTVKVGWADDGRPEVKEYVTPATAITLTPPSGKTFSTGKWYYLAALPVKLQSGYKFTLTKANGTSTIRKNSAAVTLKRAIWGVLKDMDAGLEYTEKVPDNEIWYTTSSGRIINASTNDFGANLISNKYANGKGIMTFDGPVTRVPAHAFSNFDGDESATLLTISFPLSLKTIGECAFYQTEKLCRVDLPESLEYIGSQAFFYTALEELHIPDQTEFDENISVCNPNMRAFYSKYASDDHRCLIKDGTLLSFAPAGLTEYVVPEGITRLGYRCFHDMPELSDVRMPGTLRVIEDEVFGNSGLIHAVVPEGVISIGDWAFRRNEKLETISFPYSLQELGQTVVGMCPNLTAFQGKFASSDEKCLIVDGELISFAQKGVLEYTIPSEVSVIGSDAFWANEIIRKMTVSEGVKEIKRGAFFGCDALETIYMPGSLEKVGSRPLTSSSLQTILGPYASPDGRCFIFKGKLMTVATRGLTTYVLPEGIKEIGANAVLDSYLEELYIPEGVETIDEDAFRLCWRLKTISIPSTVTSIGNYDGSLAELFYGCGSLSRVLLKAKTPPTLLRPLRGNMTIYVYNDALDSYLRDPEWSKYSISGVDSFEDTEDLYESTDYSQDGNTVVLQKATKGAGIDVFILGDAFSDRLIANGRYENVMRKAYSHLFSEEPYKSCQEYFNVYMVYVVSENEVYSTFSDTALGTYFGEGTFIGGSVDMVWKYVSRTPCVSSNNTLAVVVLNSERYAGTCHMYLDYDEYGNGSGNAIAYCPLSATDDLFREVLLHEAFGHGFAKLDDEYGGGAAITETDIQWKYESPFTVGWYKNVDVTNNPLSIKWKNFLSDERYKDEGLGIFEGAGTFSYGVWRPTDDSIMRYSGGFNAPSRQAIWYRINKLAYGDSWEGTYEDFVAFDRPSRKKESASRREAYRNNSVELRPPLAPPVIIERQVGPMVD